MRKKVQKQERVEFRMDASLMAQIQLRFYSELEERVPYGAVTNYIVGLIREDMARYQGGQNASQDSNGARAGEEVLAHLGANG